VFSCQAVQQVSLSWLLIKQSCLYLPAVLHTANQQGQEEQVVGQQKVLHLQQSPTDSQSYLDSTQSCLQCML